MNWRGVKTACAAVVFSALCTPALSQNYYLVIGAFSSENDNVKEFTSYLPSSQFDTAYTIQSNNNSLHLYIMKTSSKEVAFANATTLGEGLSGIKAPEGILPSNQRLNTETKSAVQEDDHYESLVATGSNKSSENVPAGGGVPMKPKGKYFKFTIASEDGSILPGEVHHVDRTAQKELGSFSTDLYIDMMKPGPSEPMNVVCGVFGYKEVDKFIDFANPAETDGAYQDEQGAWIIPYKLERLEKGDVSVMYNVGYYTDAVAMTPASKKDLDELAAMMKENPNYVVKVHTHCNGKSGREALILNSDNNFFETTGSTQVRVSAKELTNLRAQAIKSYLALKGISEDRVKTYGWGGSEMLVKENDPNARLNDRVEIEILKD
jgi:outer membrane protein OmpA-like peptidoglycan-associated protein